MARSLSAEKKAKAEYTKRYRKEHPDKVLAYNRRTIKQRANRNKARKILAKKLGKSAIKGKDLHHISDVRVNGELDNSLSNLKIVKRHHGGGTRGSNKNAKGKHNIVKRRR